MATKQGNATMETDCSLSTAEINLICQQASEQEPPIPVILINGKSLQNSLLAVNLEFLESGQSLPWPGMELIGATFDPNWGFSCVEIRSNASNASEFVTPSRYADYGIVGDMCGYRLCPIERDEISTVIEDIQKIRNRLSTLAERSYGSSHGLTVTSL